MKQRGDPNEETAEYREPVTMNVKYRQVGYDENGELKVTKVTEGIDILDSNEAAANANKEVG